jgi:hypothetical protein
VIADERAQEQTRELVPDRLLQPDDTRRANVLNAVQASTVLEDEGKTTGRLGLRGVHCPTIGADPPPYDPSRE